MPITSILRVAALCALMAALPGLADERPKLACDIGPVTKTYGKTPWLIYSCNDNRSVVAVAAPGNPASPFYFIFAAQAKGYRLHGEGTGSKEATSAAFEELKTLTESDIHALVAQTRSEATQNADVTAERLGDGHYLLTLTKSQSIPVELGKLELRPTAKALCKSDNFEYGKYAFESSEQLDAKPGKNKKDSFRLKQEIHCGAVDVKPAGAGSSSAKSTNVVKDDKQIERLTLEYFRAKDSGAYRDAYAFLTDSMQAITPFDQWRKSAKEFNSLAGKARTRKVVKITWYQDPPSASPGIYAAADFGSSFDNIEIHCGYVVWLRQSDGSYRLSREEQNYIDKNNQKALDPNQLTVALAKFGKGCQQR